MSEPVVSVARSYPDAGQAPPGAPPSPQPQSCFHCGLPVPPGLELHVHIDGADRPMCCRGCQAVAQAIVDGGMTDFYRFRTETTPTGKEVVPEFVSQLRAYDNPTVQERFVHAEGDHIKEAALILEGVTCAACVWLNERHLAALPGVLDVAVNYATHRARVRWDETRIRLSAILEAVSRIGYLAHPYDPSRHQVVMERERKDYLRRIGLAGVLGMQVMILAVALYAGDWWGIEPSFRTFFRWTSLVLTLPVLIYSAQPFFLAAWRDLRHRQVGMDVPVSLGITIAFVASTQATITGLGEVYFDSVVMFTFFLLTARFFDLAARKKAAESTEALMRLQPATATRLAPDGSEAVVAVADLVPGDRVLVRPGESVPADGVVAEGRSSSDESLLTGESLPVAKAPGDPLVGGSTNVESPLVMVVEKTGADTVLAAIVRLLDRAQAEKPAIARLADRIAGRFIAAILMLVVFVAAYWWWRGAEDWLAITISLLVVTCPCALSLATPAAITAATGRLTRLGLLTTRGHALETLAKADHFVFDKTGTLTEGRLELLATHPLTTLDGQACQAVAAALERRSEHPIARAMLDAAPSTVAQVEAVSNMPGEGVEGSIAGGRWWLGRPSFVTQRSGSEVPAALLTEAEAHGRTVVVLADEAAVRCLFVLGDELRPAARAVIEKLRHLGMRTVLLTGDREAPARSVAERIGVDELVAGLRPDDKLARVQAIQQAGGVVAMVGDGINDAPVLAAAQVSIAMGSGTQLAAASADMILLSDRLERLVDGVEGARRTLRIIRENLIWALGYNAVAIPAAALGYVEPWMAAIGMSASSLLVVLNALRLTR